MSDRLVDERGAADPRVSVVRRLLGSEKVRFLLVGGWNTLFAYGMLWVLDSLLHARLHYTLIVTLNWVIGVTQNLFTFKLFVFRTKGSWLKEYLRSYVVYIAAYVLNLAIISLVMELLRPSDLVLAIGATSLTVPKLMVAALPALLIVTVVSYVGHKYFTYRRSPGASG
jgi:putative flippase GtrA